MGMLICGLTLKVCSLFGKRDWNTAVDHFRVGVPGGQCFGLCSVLCTTWSLLSVGVQPVW